MSTLKNMATEARSVRQRLQQSTFVRDVLWLSGGTGAAQAITLAALPVLSRLYSPEDFGLLALYISIVMLLSVFTSFNYELMILRARSHRSASQLVWLILAIALCTAGATLVIVALFRHQIADLLGVPELAAWLWTLPMLMLVTAAYQALRYWKLRMQQFSVISRSWILRSSVFVAVAAVMALTPLATRLQGGGLIVAFILAEIAKTLNLGLSARHQDRKQFAPANLRRIKAVSCRHGPMSATVSLSLAMMLIYDRMPNFMITSFFGAGPLGFYSIVERVVGAPSRLVSKAIADVYRQRASELHRKQGRFGQLALNIIGSTAAISLFPFFVAIIYAPTLFSMLLGPEWEPAGHYASILLVGEFVAFIINPIHGGCLIVDDKRFIFFSTLARLLLTSSLLPVLYLGVLDLVSFLWALVGIRILMVIIEGSGNLMCAVRGRAVTKPPYPWTASKAGQNATKYTARQHY